MTRMSRILVLIAVLVSVFSPAVFCQEKNPADQAQPQAAPPGEPAMAPRDQAPVPDQQSPQNQAAPAPALSPGEQPHTLVIPKSEENTAEEPAATVQEQQKQKEPEQRAEQIYTIKQHDTLWDIANAFLKDPFLWPFIWKANPAIANADLIYPGNKLVIPNLAPIERAMEAPAVPVEKAEQTPAAPAAEPEKEQVKTSRLILPEDKPVPIMDKYSMLNAGFVDQEESADRIVGSLEEKTIFGYDDIVYVRIKSKKDVAIGDKFIIYEPLERVKHPVTGRNYGRLTRIQGVLQITEKGSAEGIYSGRITISFDAADRKSLLTPYQEPTLVYPEGAQAKAKDIDGYILEVVDGRTINAQFDVVYLDKGSSDSVEPGDRFLVYPTGKNGKYPRNVIGEAQVFLVKEHTSTAIIRKSSDAMAKGDVVEFEK